jgi:hypothetical protein
MSHNNAIAHRQLFFDLINYLWATFIQVLKLSCMKKYFLVVMLCSVATGFAQLSDDVPDTRSKKESFLKIGQKDIRAEVASFAMGGIEESVGKQELNKIPFTAKGSNFMKFEGANIKASVTTAPFEPARHKLDYDEKYLIKIDRKTYYGGYPNLPKTQISSVTLIIDKDTVVIPPVAYFDLYNLNLGYLDKKGNERSTNGIYISKDNHTVYFYLFSKDDSGSYEVTWVIRDKKYLRRVLDYDIL